MATKRVPKGMVRDTSNSKVIHMAKVSRAGWADAFRCMAAAGDDHLVHADAPTATKFDVEEWQW